MFEVTNNWGSKKFRVFFQSHDVQIIPTLIDKVEKLKFVYHHKFWNGKEQKKIGKSWANVLSQTPFSSAL